PARQSAEVPSVNPVLLADWTQVRFNLKPAHDEMTPTTYMLNHHFSAKASAAMHIRLISQGFPWSIEIFNNKPVTCGDVWNAVYVALQEHIVDSEWGIANDELRKEIEKAAKKRIESDSDVRLKRIDWLGSDTVFAGLQRMEEFQEELLLPSAEPCAETWVV
ncbi:hypothetical protein FB451DRAFT_1461409, partial [Mycena latifolia]